MDRKQASADRQLQLEQQAHEEPDDQAEQDAQFRAWARELFGEPIEEPLIVNAELGIFPVDDEDE